jgi:hypothetical protein
MSEGKILNGQSLGVHSSDSRRAESAAEAAESEHLRGQALPAAVGDSSLNAVIAAMRGEETQDSDARQMLDGFSLTFDSMDEAGIAGSRLSHDLTQLTGKEWGGLVYKDQDGKFHITAPVTNEVSGAVEPSQAESFIPEWSKGQVVADYHSHTVPETQAEIVVDPPAVSFTQESGWTLSPGDVRTVLSENPMGQRFSGIDKYSAYQQQRPAFMADPEGHVHKFTPAPKPHPDLDVDTDNAGIDQVIE